MEEVWKDIPDFEGMYQASNLGRIRSLDRMVKRMGKPFKKTGKLMSMTKQAIGYRAVKLYKDIEFTQMYVHRAVMYTFNGKCDLTIDHINGDKGDNRLENLRYCTQRENLQFFYSKTNKFMGAHKSPNGWRALITVRKKTITLGYFSSAEEAHKRYCEEAKKVIL